MPAQLVTVIADRCRCACPDVAIVIGSTVFGSNFGGPLVNGAPPPLQPNGSAWPVYSTWQEQDGPSRWYYSPPVPDLPAGGWVPFIA